LLLSSFACLACFAPRSPPDSAMVWNPIARWVDGLAAAARFSFHAWKMAR